MEQSLNPTQIAAELNLPVHRDYGGQTITREQLLDAAVQMYWLRNATVEIKRAG